MEKAFNLFVYGTLKKGQRANNYLKDVSMNVTLKLLLLELAKMQIPT